MIVNNTEYSDVESMFRRIKELLKPSLGHPKTTDGYTISKQQDYLYLSQWLNQNGYYLEQMPHAFKDGSSLIEVGNGAIRSAIQDQKNDYESSVKWDERRAFIEKLILKKIDNNSPLVPIKKDLMETIKEISNRDATFMELSLNEKLENLNNSLEFLLKKEGRFIEVEDTVFYDFLTNDAIKKFRKETQVYRHSSKDSLKERELFSKEKKEFYVGIGVLLVTAIHQNLN